MAESQPQDAFSTYFASPSRYGDRWHNTLYPALLKQQNKAIFYNRYTPLEDFNRITGNTSPADEEQKIERVTFPSPPNDIQADNLSCYLRNAQIPTPEPLSNGLRPYTYIPTPLALAVHLLQVQPGDRVLEHGDGDGSISVAIAQSLWPHLQPSSPTPPLAGAKKAALHANWVDTGASEPISTAFREHLPTSLGPTGNGEAMILAPGIVPDGGDMIEAPPFGSGGYDKVFIQSASLSEAAIGERKQNIEGGLADGLWPSAESQMVANSQVRVLMAAMGAVRFGGRVMFTSTSVDGVDNDWIVRMAVESVGEAARSGACNWMVEVEGFGEGVERGLEEGWAERAERGWIVLPDHKGGRGEGPLYFCMFTKNRV